jgi:hypothetical protein
MKTAILAIALIASGCATITNGTRQDITFTVPEHQVCAVSRVDGVLGSVQASAPSITVERNRHPITLDCGDIVKVYEPRINAAGYTSIGLIDFGLVDFATGALWEYKQ